MRSLISQAQEGRQASMRRKEGATKSSEDNDAVAELGASNTVKVSSVKSRKFFLRGTCRASQRPPSNDLATSMGNARKRKHHRRPKAAGWMLESDLCSKSSNCMNTSRRRRSNASMQ